MFQTGDRVLVLVNNRDSIYGDVQEAYPLVVRVGEWWFSTSQCLLLERRRPVQLRLVR
jgi:hypothetical protein